MVEYIQYNIAEHCMRLANVARGGGGGSSFGKFVLGKIVTI